MSVAHADPVDSVYESLYKGQDALADGPLDKLVESRGVHDQISAQEPNESIPVSPAVEVDESIATDGESITSSESVGVGSNSGALSSDEFTPQAEDLFSRSTSIDIWSPDATGVDTILGTKGISPPFPEVTVAPNADAHLTDRVRLALRHLVSNLRRESQRSSVTVRELRVEAFRSHEEDTTHIVLYVVVDLPPDLALDYWETLGRLIPYWSLDLEAPLRKIVDERIILQVDWL